MRMLRWMGDNTLDMIKNEYIRENLEVMPIGTSLNKIV